MICVCTKCLYCPLRSEEGVRYKAGRDIERDGETPRGKKREGEQRREGAWGKYGDSGKE